MSCIFGLSAGCAGEELGERCLASAECASQLCYANRCLDPAADDDGDGLDNATEHRLGTHPDKVDTDDDGKSDLVEVGPNPQQPLDRDGDGLADAVESQSRDADLDCLPDELDAHNHSPNSDPLLLAREVCSQEGVCAGQADKISASCQLGVGTLTCVYAGVVGWSAVESCDGIDNDCDGVTDEGHSYQGTAVGQPCEGNGACGEGVVQCRQGRAACSTNPNGSAAEAGVELCNGVDDDCDGETDEGFGLPDAPVGVPCVGTGECGVGKVVCGDDGEARCSTDPNGPASEASPETCNGLDDDCDGDTDEQLDLGGVPVGGVCQGRGACGAGTVVCGAKGAVVCSSNPEGPDSKATSELCNGLDDNCNGQTDEGFAYLGTPLGGSCTGVGACGPGKVVCSVSGKATCSSQPDAPGAKPKQESCDGKDDDCDGETDEGFVWQGKTLGQACEGEGSCGKGIVECSAKGEVTCSSNADGSASQAQSESCDGQDDDCDGVTDEDAPPPTSLTCPAVGICAKAVGKPSCVSGAWSCGFPTVAGYQGPDETSCDGLDNDCDGLTDEGLPHVWAKAATAFAAGAPAYRLSATAAFGTSPTEMCFAGGQVARANTDLPGSPGEMWCLDPTQSRWRLAAEGVALARVGAALVHVPAGWSGSASGPAWWLLGGLSNTGGKQPPLSIDAKAGTISPLTLPGDVGGGRAFVVGDSLWRVGLGGAQGPKIQRFSRTGGVWSAATKVPQVAAKWLASACQDLAGGLWVYSLDAPPGGEAGADQAIEGRLWHLKAGAAAWVKRSSPPPASGWKALLGGQLVCEPAAGELWLHGGRTDVGLVGLRRYDIQQDQWTVPSLDVTPKVSRAYAARVGSGAVIAWGEGAKGPSERVWAATKGGSWQALHPGPKPAVGARLIRTGAGLVRVGGAGFLAQLQPSADRPVWLRTAAGYQRIPLPASQALKAARAWPLVTPAGPKQLLIWGGVADLPKPATAAVAAAAAGLSPSAGAVRLNVATGVWAGVPASKAAGLPSVRTGALITHGTINGAPTAWVFGVPAAGGAPRLWQVDPVTLATQLRWQGGAGAPGPAASTAGALLWDAKADRLLHIAAPSGLQVWAFPLGGGKPGGGSGSWKKLVEDVSAASGAVVVLGDLSIDDPLIAILPGGGGAKSALRGLTLSPTPALTSVGLAPPSWRSSAQTVWTNDGAVIAPGHYADGLAAPGLLRWSRTCGP